MPTAGPEYPSGARGEVFDAIVRRIAALPGVSRLILFGSYAKGTQSDSSDIDLAAFFDTEKPCLIEEYRLLTDICRNDVLDIQIQVFQACELQDPCGIIEEIVSYGIELPLRTE